MIKNDHRYFENRECRYYPCHEGISHLNCLFCFCPLYGMRECPGDPKFTEKETGLKKVCTDCIFPHEAGNYERIIELLKKMGYFTKEQTGENGE